MSSGVGCDGTKSCDSTTNQAGPVCGREGGSVLSAVKEFYGKTLQGTADLKSGVCTLGNYRPSRYVKQVMDVIHPDVKNKFYGCGLVTPECVEGTTILDLGSGAGFDCFVLSKLVGERGHVTGIDMTEEQLTFARDYIDYHTKEFGYQAPNVDFVHGYIEKLSDAGIQPNSYDIIISNCVLCLSPNKEAVYDEVFKALKVGGEFYFSCLYADRKVPENLIKDNLLLGEGYAGATYWHDLYKYAETIGFSAPRLVSASKFNINSAKIEAQLGDIKYVSATYRLFKLADGHRSGRTVVYDGSIPHCEETLKLDHQLTFKTGKQTTVDGEVAAILEKSRFNEAFNFLSDIEFTGNDKKSVLHDPFEYCQRV